MFSFAIVHAQTLGLSIVAWFFPCYAAASMSAGDLAYLAGGACLGGGLGLASTMGTAILISQASRDRRGSAGAVYYAAIDIGIAAGSMRRGSLAGMFGYGGLILAATGALLAAILARFSRRRR